MAIVSLNGIALGYDVQLFSGVNLQIEPGERVCLLGRNGAGKSSLLKILHGDVKADAGAIHWQPHTRVALLSQEVPAGLEGTIREIVAAAVPESRTGPPMVDIVLSKMQLSPEADFATLSVGMKRRALLARALATEPDLLLLDEPTNHLDIEAIVWLEEFLLKRRGALLFITHDRALTRRLATRILEVDRGQLFNWNCDYPTYLQRREAQLEAEQAQQGLFDHRLREEEAWLRQGVKARRTRNEGRVRALLQMREDRRQVREGVGGVRLKIQQGEKSSKRVIEVKDLHFGFDERPIVSGLTTEILRGDKICLLGPNGAGKTTLLRLLLGELTPQAGHVKHGLRMQVAYFDQMRAQLDEEKTVFDSVANGSDRVEVDGKTKHVFAYLNDFLFTKQQAMNKVAVLSGGERNRLLLAKLFTMPANMLALDEPTNDLDAETLDVLEAMLVSFSGTVLLVSHDRTFLDNVATATLCFDGRGGVKEYIGGYTDWLRQQPSPVQAKKPVAVASVAPADRERVRPRKLSYKETRELDGLPEHIDGLEMEITSLQETMAAPETYTNGSDVAALGGRLVAAERELEEALARWEALEEIRSA
ncbi:MAG: ATP-binding cassette domain-containing protein [Gemmatimonadetes bacterium]|jgi:ABC transport system ATP-binding/permease protein|nr:ATP-binding cassette domain-containing protein [Gemmatimonadota bacterium]MBT7864184.1 ATP-binding cassette domain-containing protein [Gemmatimonadota bacterium]